MTYYYLKDMFLPQLNKKIITCNKFDSLSVQLNESKNEKDLENIWKELKKYLS